MSSTMLGVILILVPSLIKTLQKVSLLPYYWWRRGGLKRWSVLSKMQELESEVSFFFLTPTKRSVSHENSKCHSWIWIQLYLNAWVHDLPIRPDFHLDYPAKFLRVSKSVYTSGVGNNFPVLIRMCFIHSTRNLVWSTAFVWSIASFDIFTFTLRIIMWSQCLTVTECFPLDKYLMCILHIILTTTPQIL